MRLTIVGAGPAYSDDPASIGACYLVEAKGSALVLDLGHGAFAGLAARTRPEDLAGVVVSHCHPDHCIDLVPLRHYLRYHLAPPRRVRVAGPAALAGRLDALHANPGFAAAALDLEVLGEGEREMGPFRIRAARVTHDEDSYALRVDDGAGGSGIVYSGDVAVADDLHSLIQQGDRLLIEASFGPGPVEPGARHLDGPAVGALAAATAPSSVLLTHLLPGRDPGATIASVRRHYTGPVTLVRPGDVFEF